MTDHRPHNLSAPAGRSASRCRRRAFTLVEILVVVVILGIAASVVIPTLGTRGDMRAQAACRAMMADLMYAQNRAIATQKTTFVRFTEGAATSFDTYELLDGTAAAGPGAAIPHPVSVPRNYAAVFSDRKGTAITAAREAAGVLLDNVRIDAVSADGTTTAAGVTVLAFDSLGVPHTWSTAALLAPLASNATVKLKSGEHTMTVTISPYTGDLTVAVP